MHDIQLQILTVLMNLETARFRDLKVPDIDSNQFVYHLKRLVSEKLLVKNGVYYSLTAAGKEYVGRLSTTNYRVRIQPKIVTLVVLQDSSGRYLLYQRKMQPFIHKMGFPYGKIHLGETIAEAATRELKEKAGLEAELSHIGEAYVITHEDEELISHMLFHIFRGKQFSGELIENSKYGHFFWEEVLSSNSTRFIPGFAEILEAASHNQKHFFLEIHKHL